MSEFSNQIGLGDVTVQNQQNENETVDRGMCRSIIMKFYCFSCSDAFSLLSRRQRSGTPDGPPDYLRRSRDFAVQRCVIGWRYNAFSTYSQSQTPLLKRSVMTAKVTRERHHVTQDK